MSVPQVLSSIPSAYLKSALNKVGCAQRRSQNSLESDPRKNNLHLNYSMGFLYRTLKGSMIFEEFLVEWQNPVLASGKKKKKSKANWQSLPEDRFCPNKDLITSVRIA